MGEATRLRVIQCDGAMATEACLYMYAAAEFYFLCTVWGAWPLDLPLPSARNSICRGVGGV